MGSDFQYGLENGLWGMDGIPYGLDDGEGEEVSRRPKKRNYIENKKAKILAENLIDIKIKIRKLEEKERSLKKSLKDYVPLGFSILIENEGVIDCQKYIRPKTFIRADVLNYIENKYGENVANDIDSNCTQHCKRSNIICVRLRRIKEQKS